MLNISFRQRIIGKQDIPFANTRIAGKPIHSGNTLRQTHISIHTSQTERQTMKIKTITAAALLGLLTCGSAIAGDYATALGECLYNNTTSEDKTTLTQWAFVTLGKSSAAKSIATIPAAKTNEVDQKTKSLLTRLVASSCSKEAVQVALREPTTGLQDAVSTMSSYMIREQIRTSAKNVLSNSILTSGDGSSTSQGSNLLKNLLKR